MREGRLIRVAYPPFGAVTFSGRELPFGGGSPFIIQGMTPKASIGLKGKRTAIMGPGEPIHEGNVNAVRTRYFQHLKSSLPDSLAICLSGGGRKQCLKTVGGRRQIIEDGRWSAQDAPSSAED